MRCASDWRRLALLAVLFLVACGPGGGDKAPAWLEVEPEALEIPADSDAETVVVKNTGEESLSFSIQVSASSANVPWLEADPASGALEGGGARGVVLRVTNRHKLEPGSYQGKAVVQAAGLESRTVLVSMHVGQPVLALDPPELLDFGDSEKTRTLVIKNVGEGELTYTVTLPGGWLSTNGDLKHSIRPGEPQTLSLHVDRGLIPWYGEEEAEIVVASNGLDDGLHAGTIRLAVRVAVDASCEKAGDCTKAGYFCAASGTCTAQGDLGETCGEAVACISGYCVDGRCCDSECAGSCHSCAVADKLGYCQPLGEATACDDGSFCTVSDHCAEGECVGDPRDCAGDGCLEGVCDEAARACVTQVADDGTACDDENPCTVNDVCMAGACGGESKDCSAVAGGDPCRKGICDAGSAPEPGACVVVEREEGEACEDGIACTDGSVCDSAGECVGGTEMTGADCEALLGNESSCLAGACSEPEGCVLEPLADGTPCTLPHASGVCSEGDCVFDACFGGYGNCDEVPDNGCEEDLAQSLAHCGDCVTSCEAPQVDAQCVAGACVVEGCAEGFADCDALFANGCEAELATSAAHCGQCGLGCIAAALDEVGVCLEGQCGVQACPTGFYDLDGDPTSGCEADNILWVDALAPGGSPDGTKGNPYPTLGQALAAAEADSWIYVAAGVYGEGDLEVAQPQTRIIGAGREDVVIAVPAGSAAGLEVSGDETVIRGLTVQGGGVGIVVAGEPFEPVSGALLTDLLVYGQGGGEASRAVGIRADEAAELTISDVEIASVQGSTGGEICQEIAAPGQAAAGIELVACVDCRVEKVTVSGVTGGTGGSNPLGWCDGPGGPGGAADGVLVRDSAGGEVTGVDVSGVWGGAGGNRWLQPAGWGGPAAAFRLADSTGVILSGASGEQITGGAGGVDNDDDTVAGTGGLAVGLHLVGTSGGNSVSETAFSGLTGGLTANVADESAPLAQGAYGIYLEPGALANTVAATTTLEGDPIYYLHGINGAQVTGQELKGAHNPTNLGIIVVVESSNVIVADNDCAGHQGAYGLHAAKKGEPAMPGESGCGIRFQDCTNCTASGNVVQGVRGGDGGLVQGATDGAPGGEAAGIVVVESKATQVLHNRVQEVTGGGGSGTVSYKAAGAGGRGAGVVLTGGQQLEVAGNLVVALEGGRGGGDADAPAEERGGGGHALAYALEAVAGGLTFGNNGAANLEVGEGAAAGVAACVAVAQGGPVTVSHLSCARAGLDRGAARAVWLRPGATPSVTVENSILAQVAGWCLWNDTGVASKLQAAYTDLWDCAAGEAQEAQVAPSCLSVAPAFAGAGQGDLALTAESPCIDSGDPAAACGQEPAPNGCAVNLGAFGNTPDAQSAPDAGHCPVCPAQD